MLRNDQIKEFFGIPFTFVKFYFDKAIYQDRKGDNKVQKMIPPNDFISDDLIATEWIIAAKL